jgi:hypothetical protein
MLKVICFWEKDADVFYNLEDKPDHPYEKWVNRLNYVSKAIQWVWDKVQPEIDYVKIDYWDTWSMDNTLAPIILPMLKQLKATRHGYGMIDDEDVPKHLHSIYALPKEKWDWDGNAEARYVWVMDEMIWAFEQMVNPDSDAKFHTGNADYKSVPCEWDENGKPTIYKMEEGPNHTAKFDIEGHRQHHLRIDNGLRLFGKYFRTLWD